MQQIKDKFIFNPIAHFFLHQSFGENKACIPLSGGSVINCNGHKPPTGYKSVYSMMKGHNGLDLGAVSWEKCYAPQKGIVAEVSTEEARGLGVGIITEYQYWCNETQSYEHFIIRHWHFWANNVEVGQKVAMGDLIGHCGSTGFSSGVHLHLEVKPVKVSWRKGAIRNYSNILQTNGFFGAVDPQQYMHTKIQALAFAGLWKQTKEMVARVADLIAEKTRG